MVIESETNNNSHNVYDCMCLWIVQYTHTAINVYHYNCTFNKLSLRVYAYSYFQCHLLIQGNCRRSRWLWWCKIYVTEDVGGLAVAFEHVHLLCPGCLHMEQVCIPFARA